MKNINLSSRLRHRITIETAEGYRIAEVWAGIEPTSDSQKSIMIRYIDGITTSMFIAFGNKKFTIVAIKNPYEENILLEILVEEQANEQLGEK